MKRMVIQPRNQTEYEFLLELLNKMGILSTTLSEEELEDVGLSNLMKEVDKKKKVKKEKILKKLRS